MLIIDNVMTGIVKNSCKKGQMSQVSPTFWYFSFLIDRKNTIIQSINTVQWSENWKESISLTLVMSMDWCTIILKGTI